MTSLLPGLRSGDRLDAPPRSPVLIAGLAGASAALGTLVVALAVGVVGWFASDVGTHGRPSAGLRVGALGWLLGHGSGVDVQGVPVTMIPLGITVVLAAVCWRLGVRVGDAVADDRGLLFGSERDLVVPTTTGVFAAAYVLVALATAIVATGSDDGVSLTRVTLFAIVLAAGVGGAGIAVGSGRAAQWRGLLPIEVRDTAVAVGVLLLAWTGCGALLVAVGLGLGFSEAASVLTDVGSTTGPTLMFAGIALLALPNAVLFGSAYALGPGFAVGSGTVVSPSVVALGPVPLFPLIAAVPDAPAPPWLAALLTAAPFLVAAAATALVQRSRPTDRWDVGIARGAATGVLGGIVVALMARLAAGAVGPGRMEDVGPFAGDVLVHSVAAFTTGSVLAAVLMTAWQRRAA